VIGDVLKGKQNKTNFGGFIQLRLFILGFTTLVSNLLDDDNGSSNNNKTGQTMALEAKSSPFRFFFQSSFSETNRANHDLYSAWIKKKHLT